MTTNAAAQEASNFDGRVRLYSYGADKAWLYDDQCPDDVSEDEYISAIMPRDETPADEWIEVYTIAGMALPHEDGRVYRHKGAKWPRYCVLGYGCWVQVSPLARWFDTAMPGGLWQLCHEDQTWKATIWRAVNRITAHYYFPDREVSDRDVRQVREHMAMCSDRVRQYFKESLPDEIVMLIDLD